MTAVPAPAPDDAVAWHHGNPVAEARALDAGRALVDLSQLELVTVSGPDRLRWLHAITSQHLAALAPGDSTEAFILSPHGQVEHAFAVVDDGERAWLVTDVGGAAPLVTFLDSMRFASRVEVATRPDLAVLGRSVAAGGEDWELAGWQDPWPRTTGTSYSVADDSHPGAGWVLRLSVVERTATDAITAGWVAAGGALAGMWALEAARIAAWRPRPARELDERTIPHELDWLRTAVHLEKGCYRGQETVARVVNLGRPPRRLTFLHLDGSVDELPEPGATVTLDGRAVGRVTSSARHHELGPVALAVLKRSADPSATLLVDGTVTAAQEVIVRPDGTADATPASRPGADLRRGSRA
ncbi:MAG: YgfZ/GcvT domain-containing protein [Actinomycetota bacterium]